MSICNLLVEEIDFSDGYFLDSNGEVSLTWYSAVHTDALTCPLILPSPCLNARYSEGTDNAAIASSMKWASLYSEPCLLDET